MSLPGGSVSIRSTDLALVWNTIACFEATLSDGPDPPETASVSSVDSRPCRAEVGDHRFLRQATRQKCRLLVACRTYFCIQHNQSMLRHTSTTTEAAFHLAPSGGSERRS